MTTSLPEPLHARLHQLRNIALTAGLSGTAVSLLLALISPGKFMPSYLVAYMYCVGIALGSISLLCLHNLVGGGWGAAIRRPLEAGAMTILPLAVLFLPIVIGAGALYPWVRPDSELAREIAFKRHYLSVGWFLFRAVLYFALWSGLAYAFNRLSKAQDETENPRPTELMQAFSGPGLVAMFLSMTFATIDWAMSLEPTWYSTIYGAMFIIGWGLTTFALMIVAACLLSAFEPVRDLVTPNRLHDLGNLMMAFVMLWAYMSFSQFLIIWAGDIPEETPWYLKRSGGGWWSVALFLILFHFFVPFLILLVRDTKRNARVLLLIAAAIAVVHLVDICWLILPSKAENPLEPYMSVLSVLGVLVAMIGLGGLSLASFLWFLVQKDLVPRRLPGMLPAGQAVLEGGH